MKDITENVNKVLSQVYKPESLFLKTAEIIGLRKYKFSFVFPDYDFASQSIDHVSGIQMHLALFQGFIASIFLAVNEGHMEGDTNELSRNVFSASMIRENVDFVQPVKPGEIVYVEFKLSMYGKIIIGKKHNFYRVGFNGFVKGEAEAVSQVA